MIYSYIFLLMSLIPRTTTETKSLSITQDYAVYNYWANNQMIAWLDQANDSLWSKEVTSSFSSLEATVFHLLNAEHGWLTVLNQQDWGNAEQPETKTKQLELWRKTSFRFGKQALNLLGENTINRVRKLGDDEVSLEAIVHHVCNHATYHRGQLITIGRQLGLSNPPRTDFIFFERLPETDRAKILLELQSE